MRFTATSFLLAASISGCAAIGPSDSPEGLQLVARAVPNEDSPIRYSGSGNWFPSVQGFTAMRRSMFAPVADPIVGALVITDTALLFERWDDATKRFDVMKRIPWSEISEVTLDTYGLARRLVLRSKDLTYQSFDFTRSSGNAVDGAKVEAAVKYLRGRGVTPPAE